MLVKTQGEWVSQAASAAADQCDSCWSFTATDPHLWDSENTSETEIDRWMDREGFRLKIPLESLSEKQNKQISFQVVYRAYFLTVVLLDAVSIKSKGSVELFSRKVKEALQACFVLTLSGCLTGLLCFWCCQLRKKWTSCKHSFVFMLAGRQIGG